MNYFNFTKTSKFKGTHVWFCAALFYLFQFVIRVSPSVMVDDLMLAYGLDATGFATLSALAMYGYSVMQIPAGIVADLYGARRCILISILICTIGTLLFCSTSNLWIAQVSRILIGMGSAGAFLCVSKISVNWFGTRLQAQMFGLTMMAGTIGALNGGAPLAYCLNFFTWQETLFILGCIGFVIWGINYFMLQDSPQAAIKTDKLNFQSLMAEALASLRALFAQPQCWLSAISAMGVYSCICVLADLWGVSFLMQAYEIGKQQAAQVTSFIYVGLCVGSVMIPFISQRILGNKKFILLGLGMIAASFYSLVYGPHYSIAMASGLCLMIGFFSGVEMLCFANACSVLPSRMAGIVTGFVNGVVMLGGSLLQQMIGYVLDRLWDGTMTEQGTRAYSTSDFQSAFYLLGGCIIVTLVISFFLKSQRNTELSLSSI